MLVLDLDIGIDRVCTLVKVFSIRPAGRGFELLLFGRQLFMPGARRPLLGCCGLPVGLESSDFGEVTRVRCLVPMCFHRRFSTALRRHDAEGDHHDDRDNDDDDYKSSHPRRLPGPRSFKPDERARSRSDLTVSGTRPPGDGDGVAPVAVQRPAEPHTVHATPARRGVLRTRNHARPRAADTRPSDPDEEPLRRLRGPSLRVVTASERPRNPGDRSQERHDHRRRAPIDVHRRSRCRRGAQHPRNQQVSSRRLQQRPQRSSSW